MQAGSMPSCCCCCCLVRVGGMLWVPAGPCWGSSGAVPAGGAQLWGPCSGTLAHSAQYLQAGTALLLLLTLPEDRWLWGPLLQALDNPWCRCVQPLWLEQVQKELQELPGNSQYIFWGRFLQLRKAKPGNGCVTLEMCLKNKLQGKFCKTDVGTSNGHEVAMNKFGLEVKFLTIRRIKLLDSIPIAEAREEFKSNSFKKLFEMGLVARGLSLYQEEHWSHVLYLPTIQHNFCVLRLDEGSSRERRNQQVIIKQQFLLLV